MKKLFLSFWIIFFFSFPIFSITATSLNNENKSIVNIYFFHSNACPHCKKENQFLKQLAKENKNIYIYRYEVHDEKNQDYIKKLEDVYQISLKTVPLTIVGNTLIYGFSDEKSEDEIRRAVSYYAKYGYEDKLRNSFKTKTIPQIKGSNNTITYEKYLKMSNQKILGFLPIFTLDNYTNSTILGILSVLNPLFLLLLFLFFFLIKKYFHQKEKIFLLATYFFFSFLTNFFFIFFNKWVNLCYLFFTIILIFTLGKKQKKNQVCNLLLIIFFVLTFLGIKYSPFKSISLLIHINNIYQYQNWQKTIYYSCYFISIFLFDLILFSILSLQILETTKDKKEVLT